MNAGAWACIPNQCADDREARSPLPTVAMKTLLAATLAASTLLALTTASADPDATLARADALLEAARATATRVRRRWDEARKLHRPSAPCLEDKTTQATMLAKTVGERRSALASTSDPEERARLARRLEALEERRVHLEGEALQCH